MPLFASALLAAWILLLGKPLLIKGDHHLLGTDFHPGILFGSTPSNPSNGLPCGINSLHDQHVLQFCTKVVNQCNNHQLAEHTAVLLLKPALTEEDMLKLETIDQILT